MLCYASPAEEATKYRHKAHVWREDCHVCHLRSAQLRLEGGREPSERIDGRGRGGKRDINDAKLSFFTTRDVNIPSDALAKHRCINDQFAPCCVKQKQPKADFTAWGITQYK